MKIYKIASHRVDSEGNTLGMNEYYFLKLKWKYIHSDNQPYFYGGGPLHSPNMVEMPSEAVRIKGITLEEMAYDWTQKWSAIKARPAQSVQNTISKSFNIIKIASAETDIKSLKDKADKMKDEIRDLKRDTKDFDSRLKKVEKTLDELNIGDRRFWQNQNIFTSLQRKIERFEKLESEWKKYKAEIDDATKKKVERSPKNQVSI